MGLFRSGAPVIDPEDEARPGYSAQIFTGRLSACGDCNGTGTTVDDDGSVTGHRGASISCSCSACFDLEADYPERKLAQWAHMLGFRGHFSTKSRHYSTTLGALRQVRADYRARQERRERGLPDPDDAPEGSTLTLAHWAYAGHGHTPGESWLAANIARDLAAGRTTAREALADLDDPDDGWEVAA